MYNFVVFSFCISIHLDSSSNHDIILTINSKCWEWIKKNAMISSSYSHFRSPCVRIYTRTSADLLARSRSRNCFRFFFFFFCCDSKGDACLMYHTNHFFCGHVYRHGIFMFASSIYLLIQHFIFAFVVDGFVVFSFVLFYFALRLVRSFCWNC